MSSPDPTPDLGPVILERKASTTGGLVLLVFGTVLSAVGGLMAVLEGPPLYNVVTLIELVAAGVLLAGGLLLWQNVGRGAALHEQGLRHYHRGGQQVVLYRDVDELTFQSTRIFHHGSYVSTVHHLGLRPADSAVPPLTFSHVYKERTGLITGYADPTAVQRLADAIAAAVAGRMADRLARGESVPWTPGLRLTGRGFEITEKGGGWESVAWDRVARVELEQGVCRLWVEGEAKPRAEVKAGATNFFPG